MKVPFSPLVFNSAFFCMSAISITACSSSDTSGTDSDVANNVSKIGTIQIDDHVTDNEGSIFLAFVGLEEEMSKTVFFEEIGPVNLSDEDECEVVINGPEDPDTPEIGGVSISGLSAGEVITVSSPAGSFTELLPSSFFGPSVYVEPDNMPYPFPTGLRIDIPGDEFPAFDKVVVPDIEPFVLTSLPDTFQHFSISQEITWEPGTPSDANIVMYLDLTETSITVTDDTESSYTARRVEIDCVLKDDGSFSFSTEIQTQLSDAGFNEIPLDIGRRITTTRQEGDAILIISNSSGDL